MPLIPLTSTGKTAKGSNKHYRLIKKCTKGIFIMANIRFIKPSNDNRVRSLPTVFMNNDVINVKSSSKNDIKVAAGNPQKINNLHTTKPSRKINNFTATDIFITSKVDNSQEDTMPSFSGAEICDNTGTHQSDNKIISNKNYEMSGNRSHVGSSFFSEDSIQGSAQEFIISNLPSVPVWNEDHNLNMSLKTANNDARHEMICDHEKTSSTGSQLSMRTGSCAEISENNTDNRDYLEGHKAINDVSSSESPSKNDHTKRKITRFSSSCTVSDSENDMEEDLDQLEDINLPGAADDCHQTQRHRLHKQKKLCPEFRKQQIEEVSSLMRQNLERQSTCFQNSGVDRKNSERNPLIYRSISDAALIDGTPITSFFRSINDAKFYETDQNETLDFADMAVTLDEAAKSAAVNDQVINSRTSKIAWDEGSANHKSDNASGSSQDRKLSSGGPGRSPKFKSSDGHAIMSRSLSAGDSVTPYRLRIRRCALADPENMIMRQEVREKIEREVERRKSSMTRKISQFFNIHLGLNREEDLI